MIGIRSEVSQKDTETPAIFISFPYLGLDTRRTIDKITIGSRVGSHQKMSHISLPSNDTGLMTMWISIYRRLLHHLVCTRVCRLHSHSPRISAPTSLYEPSRRPDPIPSPSATTHLGNLQHARVRHSRERRRIVSYLAFSTIK